ncbi:hypothetical protein FXO38_04523 [Capsicum annuum]|nr:hypothetical protein FXO37_29500 [Capsicum annuum]KAF3675995.1 hypothetical protein FXO38_04523 [Capsicum annuum]
MIIANCESNMKTLKVSPCCELDIDAKCQLIIDHVPKFSHAFFEEALQCTSEQGVEEMVSTSPLDCGDKIIPDPSKVRSDDLPMIGLEAMQRANSTLEDFQSKSYFKFENWWLNQEGFVEKVKNWWSEFEFYGKPDYILACKLKALKGKLKQWSRQEQGNLKLQKNIRALTEEEIAKKATLFMEYEGCLKLYTEPEDWRPSQNIRNHPTITEDKKEALQAHLRTPGPDGYTMGFYLSCWEIIKQDIMKVFHNFHSTGMFEKSYNATYIALISKKIGAKELKDFRPISLIGSFYKLISKVLTKRLKKVVDKLVNKQQMAFIRGRQIMDAVLIANEAIDSRMSHSKPGILCKLDIEKAYDHVNWDSILSMLRQIGFGERWIRRIKFCMSTVKISVLINGSPEVFFNAHRGIRQGDLISLLVHHSYERAK